MKFHAVMLDETRCEFGIDFEASNHDKAEEFLRDAYPESRCVQLETIEQSKERERQMMLSVEDDMYYDDFEDDFDD